MRAPILLVSASILTAWCFVAADSLIRDGWQHIQVQRHFLAAIALYTAAGGLAGLGAWALISLERGATARARLGFPRTAAWVGPLLYGALAGAASISTATWTFSGERVKHTALAGALPVLFVIAVGAGAALIARATIWTFARLERGQRAIALAAAGSVALAALVLMYVDLHLFVALYTRLHSLLELTAALLLGIAWSLLLTSAWTSLPRLRWLLGAASALAVYWTGMVVLRGWTRHWLDESLRHVWLEPGYAGRMLQRLQVAESFLSNPAGYQGVRLTRLAQLKERFDIDNTEQSPIWDQPYRESPEFHAAIKALRGPPRNYNVLVFYVDTLRRDATADPGIMPHVTRFAQTALSFENAYSPGSDTMRALPGLSGGNYDLNGEQPGDLVTVARRAQLESVLVIAQSAREFLAKLRPTFRFDQTVVISDYEPQKEVWGYGADGPTAPSIVDRSLSWLKKNRDGRFLMWLFNFDVHAWRELDERYVADAAVRYGVPDQGELNWRYRVVARAVDEQFGRLLTGLDQLGLSQKTIVLFVSDHGEALGRDGFWVHSVFLWEPLIRVPLLLRIPGLAPRRIGAKVSLVDIAPTLARYMLPEPGMKGYQGEDLIGYLVPGRPKRRLPILTQASSQQILSRVGIVDAAAPWKLVLNFESGLPELYDLRLKDPDAVNTADQNRAVTLRLLSTLVRSPVFPRAAPADAAETAHR